MDSLVMLSTTPHQTLKYVLMFVGAAPLFVIIIWRTVRVARLVPSWRVQELLALPLCLMPFIPAITGDLSRLVGTAGSYACLFAIMLLPVFVLLYLRRRAFARIRTSPNLLCTLCFYPQPANVNESGGVCPECGHVWAPGELVRKWQEAERFYRTTLLSSMIVKRDPNA